MLRRLIKKSEFYDYIRVNDGEMWPIFKNPTKKETLELKSNYSLFGFTSNLDFRALVMKDGTVYAWPADILHEFMESTFPQMYDTSKALKLVCINYEELHEYIEKLRKINWLDN